MTHVWIDLSCPWCYGALPTIRNLVGEEAEWHFIRLHPMPETGMAYQISPDLARYLQARGRVLAERSWQATPHLAHRALLLARRHQPQLMGARCERLWSAHWGEGLDCSGLDMLQNLLELPESLWQELASGGGQAELQAERELAQQIGLDGVPRIYRNSQRIPAWLEPDEVNRLWQQAGT